MAFVRSVLAKNEVLASASLAKILVKRDFVVGLEKAVFESGQRLFIISGLRGTGKTTALFQVFAQTVGKKIYVSCDELSARRITLSDFVEALEVAETESVGVRNEFFLFLDEITYLEKWDIELKILVDKKPNLFVLASSSSVLHLRSTTELSRRAFEVFANPLSFREYLHLMHGVKIPDSLAKKIREKLGKESLEKEYTEVLTLCGSKNLFGVYEEYLKFDLPFCLNLNEEAYVQAVKGVIKRTIYEDFSRYAFFETRLLPVVEKLVVYLATVPCDGVKIVTLSEVLGISKDSVVKILETLEKALLIKGVEHEGRNRSLKKPKKWFFYSPSMRLVLASPTVGRRNLTGSLREDSVFMHLYQLSQDIAYSHEADFEVNNLKIEVGGIGKKSRAGVLIAGTEDKLTQNFIPIPLLLLAV